MSCHNTGGLLVSSRSGGLGSAPEQFLVGFVVDKLEIVHALSEYFGSLLPSIFPPLLHSHSSITTGVVNGAIIRGSDTETQFHPTTQEYKLYNGERISRFSFEIWLLFLLTF
jgi:hypothetical protein